LVGYRHSAPRAAAATLLATALGAKSKSEAFGYGGDEFAPWHFGATL
jgi:altronate dehydratase